MTANVDRLVTMSGVVPTRTAVKELVKARRISVEWRAAIANAVPEIVEHPGARVNLNSQRVLLDGRPLPTPPPAKYILFQKPAGCLTTRTIDTHKSKRRPSVMDVIARSDQQGLVDHTVKPVGRLDCESEGLLIFTNDGRFSKILTHPDAAISKQYLTIVNGRRLPKHVDRPTLGNLRQLVETGVQLGASTDFVRAEKVQILNPSCVMEQRGWYWDASCQDCLSITLREGKYREGMFYFLIWNGDCSGF